MPPLSDRQHDAFDNAAKMACREGNLRVLREAAHLLREDAERTRRGHRMANLRLILR